jgi:hypothetical protein
MSHTVQSDDKMEEKVWPTVHWETPHSVQHGCDTMYTMFNEGLNVNRLESDDCPSEDESDAPSLTPHCLAKSVSPSESECDEFDEDLWDTSEFTTYQCNTHLLNQP